MSETAADATFTQSSALCSLCGSRSQDEAGKQEVIWVLFLELKRRGNFFSSEHLHEEKICCGSEPQNQRSSAQDDAFVLTLLQLFSFFILTRTKQLF